MTLSIVPAGILSLPGSIVRTVVGAPIKEAAQVGLDVVSSWVVVAAEGMLHEVVKLISTVTTPSLSLSWFSVGYWQMAALAMLLTLPFLFAAAVQAVIQTNLGILVRAAFVDLPIAAIAVTLTAPVITLMLAATDQMCSLVNGAGQTTDGSFLTLAATQLSGVGDGFMLVVIAVVILLAGLTLLVELIMRSAAIYIVVLFLPLGFAAMVWPARRVWLKRMLETLVALILSKFAMVAILSLTVAGLASLSTTPSPVTTALTAMALLVLATLSPWALLRLLPFTEIAAGAALMLHQDARQRLPQRKDKSGASAAGDAAAGLTVDPAADATGALRTFVTGNSADDFGAGGRLLRHGGGRELPPTDGASGQPPDEPGPGPDAGGGAPAGIVPVGVDDGVAVLEAAGAVGAGAAVGAASSSAGTARAAVGSSGAAGAAGSPAGTLAAESFRSATSPAASGSELDSPDADAASTDLPPVLPPLPAGGELTGGARFGGASTGSASPGGALAAGPSTRGAMPGGELTAAGGTAETVGGPVDLQAPFFGDGGLMNLTGIGDPIVADGEQPEPGET